MSVFDLTPGPKLCDPDDNSVATAELQASSNPGPFFVCAGAGTQGLGVGVKLMNSKGWALSLRWVEMGLLFHSSDVFFLFASSQE